MNLITWSEKMSVGLETLDNDHKKLVDLFNALHRLTKAGSENTTIDLVLDELVHYTQYHFFVEEKILELCKYPGLEKHRKLHKNLQDKLHNFVERHKQHRNLEDDLKFYDFLTDWMVRHTLGEDQKYKDYVQKIADKRRNISTSASKV